MAETRTDRFGLVQWSSGSDSPSRLDLNEAYFNLEQRAALDTGVTYDAMPATLLTAGRYAMVAPAAEPTYRTLYRRNDGGTWEQAIGSALRNTLTFRAQGQARTDSAVVFSHPDHVNPGATIDYGGSALLTGTVRIWDTDDSTRGVMMIGTSLAADPVVRGRLHVRTRATGERGLVIQPYTPPGGDPGSGDLLTVRTAGGSDVWRIDALGRMRATPSAAFGGASVPTMSVLAVSPTSNPADGVTNGLLLYGQEAAATRSILRVQPDNTADLVPIMLVLRDGITIGRLPWGTPNSGSGTTTIAGNSVYVRGSSLSTDVYFEVRRSDPTSPATEADPSKDISLLRVGPNGVIAATSLSVSNTDRLSSPTMVLYRVTNFASSFLELNRLVPDGLGGETTQAAARWASDGRLATGAWWKSTGTTRDARQSVKHYSRKFFANPTDGAAVGQAVDTNQTFLYTWAAMTVRSSTTTDLEIRTGLEFLIVPSPTQADANSFLVETLISVNGGAYVLADTTHYTSPSQETGARIGGDVFSTIHRATNLAPGAVFTLRTRLVVSVSVPDFRLRMLDLQATEVIFEAYAPPT